MTKLSISVNGIANAEKSNFVIPHIFNKMRPILP